MFSSIANVNMRATSAALWNPPGRSRETSRCHREDLLKSRVQTLRGRLEGRHLSHENLSALPVGHLVAQFRRWLWQNHNHTFVLHVLIGQPPEELVVSSTWISPGALYVEWRPGMFSGSPHTIIIAGGVSATWTRCARRETDWSKTTVREDHAHLIP